MQRMAAHADRNGFDRFLKSLEPDETEQREVSPASLPEGFTHDVAWE